MPKKLRKYFTSFMVVKCLAAEIHRSENITDRICHVYPRYRFDQLQSWIWLYSSDKSVYSRLHLSPYNPSVKWMLAILPIIYTEGQTWLEQWTAPIFRVCCKLVSIQLILSGLLRVHMNFIRLYCQINCRYMTLVNEWFPLLLAVKNKIKRT